VSTNDWREVPWDPETLALRRLARSAVGILQGPSSPLEMPRWVENFARNPRRLELTGREGAKTLDAWRAQTEERIAALLGHRPWGLLHLLSILRRLPTDAAFLGEREEEGGLRRFDAYQAAVTERAALKYARWDASGVEIDAWEPGTLGFTQDRPAVDARRLAEIFSLLELGAVRLAYLERIRRSIVRGQAIILRPDGVADSRPGPELRRRIHLYDERAGKFSFLGETAGTIETSDDDDMAEGGLLATHAVRTTYREDEGGNWFRYELSRRLIQKREKRFIVDRARGLGPAYEYLKLLEEEVAAQYGLSPEIIVAALSALNEALERFLAPWGMEGTLLDTFAERLAYLDKRGYLIVRDEVMDGSILGSWAADAYRRAFPDAPSPGDPDRFAHGLKRLAYLDSYHREDLSLEDGKPWVQLPEFDEPVPMPVPFVYPAGDYRVVDLNAVGDFLQGVVDCLRLEEAPRQRVSTSLEQRLGDYFDRELAHPRAFEPSKKLLVQDAPGRHSREIAELDVSVRVGSVLVTIDAKAIHVSPGYRRFVHADLRNRWHKFERYVEHADEQAKKLAAQPRGTNYDLLADGYTHIVTLLCSTVPEFVATDDPNFFITDDLPRVASPPELRYYLAEVAEEDLKALPFARSIGAGEHVEE
jgi:hypothetical protein